MTTLLDAGQDQDAHIAARLATEPVIWLASVRADGAPHVVPVWFLGDDTTVLIFSAPGTAKLGHIRRDPKVTLTLDSADDGNDIVILTGRAEIVDDGSVDATLPAFADKYATRRTGPAEQWAAMFSTPIRVGIERILNWVKAAPSGPPKVRDVRASG